MAIDFNKPATTDNYASAFVPAITDAFKALSQWLDPAVVGVLTNTPTGAYRLNTGVVERFNGTSWVAQSINGVSSVAGIATTTRLEIINAGALSSYLTFQANSSGQGFLGMPHAAGQLINDAAIGDLCYRVSAKAHRFSVDGGSTTALVVNTTGLVEIPVTAKIAQSYIGLSGTWATWHASTTNGSYATYFQGGTSVVAGYIGTDGGGIINGGIGLKFGIRAESDLLLMSGGGTVRMTILAAGNVSIGAPSSGNTFTVDSVGANIAGYFRSAAANDVKVSMLATGVAEWSTRVNTSGGSWVLRADSAGRDVMTAGFGGNVTIFAPSTGTALTVNGLIDTTGNQFNVTPGVGINYEFVNRSTGGLLFYTDAGAKLPLTIERLAPTNSLRLTVNGSYFATGVWTETGSQAFTATPDFNCVTSNIFEFSGAMTANVTICTISNPHPGQTITIRVKQDATGGRTFAAPAGAKISGNVQATASTASMLTLTYSAMDSRWEGSWLGLPV